MNETPHVLLVEDNPADAYLSREAFAEGGVNSTMSVARDGVEAMEMLRHQGAHANAKRPDLILLDLNMPRKNGREVLADIDADPDLRRVPVVVLSTSQSQRDITDSYNLHANGYLVKPADFDRFSEVAEAVKRFWFATAMLPSAT
jgi:CheY-like chemotaxis protein